MLAKALFLLTYLLIMFSGCPSSAFVYSFIHLSGQIMLLRYLMSGLSCVDETYTEYLSSPADDLIRFWRS